jgi:hypothetical protein
MEMVTGHLGGDEPLVDLTQTLVAAALSLTRAQDQNPRQGVLELRGFADEMCAVGADSFTGWTLGRAH